MERSNIAASEYVQSSAALHHLLTNEVSRFFSGPGERDADAFGIRRIEVPLEDVDPYAWLHAQPFSEKIFWSDRADSVTVAAAGVADLVSDGKEAGIEVLAERGARLLQTEPKARYFGGLRFDPRRPADAEWSAFGIFRFVLPRFELILRGGRTLLACNLVLPADLNRKSDILAEIRQLRLPLGPLQGSLPLPESRSDAPDEAGWTRNVEWVLNAFETGDMGKVVLARKADFGFGEAIDPILLLKNLHAATPGCFHFCFQLNTNTAFLGASPERLFLREGLAISSEAVAGTRPRGESAWDDERLREELLLSAKDQLEHAFVLRDVQRELADLCTSVEADMQPSEMILTRGRHLYTGISGTLREDVRDLDVIRALHPTPAVGGHPKEAAYAAIRTLEPFDRGWYAGLVGWIGAEGAELAVGIRSGLVRGNTLSLFSGAGIVPGSIPKAEHDEIEHKIGDFIKVLGLDS